MRYAGDEKDAHLAAKHASKLRAAFLVSLNSKKIAEDFFHSHPIDLENVTANKESARNWAAVNLIFNDSALVSTLRNLYAEAWATGDKAAEITLSRIEKAVDTWAGWQPGNAAAALMVKPPTGLSTLMDRARVTIQGLNQTSINRIGSILGDSLAQGLSASETASLIDSVLGDPARSLTVAITETRRAMSQASLDRYSSSGLSEVEWSTSDPCDICAENDGEVVTIGDTFASGDDAPPAHPNCRCAVLPVLPDGSVDNLNQGEE